MNTATDTPDLKTRLLEAFALREGDLSGRGDTVLRARRREAMGRFEALGFPTQRDENWKYTPLGQVLGVPYDFRQNQTEGALSKRDLAGQFDYPHANVLTFVNGRYEPRLSRVCSPVHELRVLNLADAEEKNEPCLERFFDHIAPPEDAFTALNTAFATHGACLYVPAGQQTQRPVVVHFISDARRGPVLSQPRNLIVLGDGARAEIVENFTTLGPHASFTNVVTEISLAPGARCYYHKLQRASAAAHHVGTTHVQQQRDSHFESTTVTTRGGVVRNNLNLTLDAENCESHMYGLYLLNGRTHCDNQTTVDHRRPRSFSNELYKGIVDDRATGVFNGRIYVRPDAQKTNAFQSNRNLLLSEDATVNTKPQLEIWADDVKCSHGATTGQLDEEALFYLRARGLDKGQARALMLRAFAAEVLDKVTLAPLRHYLDGWLDERLGAAGV